MKRTRVRLKLFLPLLILFVFTSIANATDLKQIVDVQKYDRAIHIMAMLLVGFGF